MSEYVDLTPELLAGFLDEAPSYLNALCTTCALSTTYATLNVY